MSTQTAKYGHHPDPLIDAEVEIDRLEGQLSECHGAMVRALDYRAVTPPALSIKNNIRYWLRQHGISHFGERSVV